MLAHLVETQPAGLTFGVATCGAQRAKIIVAIDDDGSVELGGAAEIGGADESVQRERGRAITPRELFDQRANARRFGGSGHGFFGGNGTADGTVGFVGVVGVLFCAVAFVRLDVLSARGSM
jgi:hypothetical protein